MNAKQRRAHIRELTALYKDTVPSEFNAELVSELIEAGKDIKHKDFKIEALRAENEALKQQVEQGKRDAVPKDIHKDAERYRWLSDYLIGSRCDLDDSIVSCVTKSDMDTVIDAAAPKQEK